MEIFVLKDLQFLLLTIYFRPGIDPYPKSKTLQLGIVRKLEINSFFYFQRRAIYP